MQSCRLWKAAGISAHQPPVNNGECALWCEKAKGQKPDSSRTFGLRIPWAKWFFTPLARKPQPPSNFQELGLLEDRSGEHIERDRSRADILACATLTRRATQ